MCEPCNLFLAKVRESQGTWVPKSQGESGNFAKTLGLKPWRGAKQFCRIRSGKILFSKSKLTDLKNSGRFFQKSIYILKPRCLDFFWYSPYLAKEARSALHVLHQAIKVSVTWFDLVQIYFTVTSQKNQSTNWVMLLILVNFTN